MTGFHTGGTASSGASILDELRKRRSSHGTVMAVSMMKDEAPFLLEWFAHHLAIGFTDILVYTNDCTDGTDEMLQRLETMGLGHHRENVIREGLKPQPSAIKHAQNEPLVQKADWVLLFDADEFLAIRHPSGHLDGVLDDVVTVGANGIVITWRIFGSGGIVDWSHEPVSEQYLRSAPPLWNKGWGVKTLFKFDAEYWKLGIHRPSIKNKHLDGGFPDTVHWLNGSGKPMEDYFKFRGWRSIRRTVGYDWVQMNHYAVKSVDSYAVRKFRGNVNNKKDKYNADYWSLQDRNEIEDRAVLGAKSRRVEIMAALLEDPVLAKLHFAALNRIEVRLAEYKDTPEYQQLKSDLIKAGQVPIAEVKAKPPKARDPAKIAAIMGRVEQENADRPKEVRRNPTVSGWARPDETLYMPDPLDLSLDTTLRWAENHGVALPEDPGLFIPKAIEAVMAGQFDRQNARNIDSYVEGCMRLLDLETGVGFIPMKLMGDRSDLVVLAHDERASLIKMARVIAIQNGLSNTAQLKFADGPLSFGSGSANGLAAYINDFRPDVIRLPAGGRVVAEMLEEIDLGAVHCVIIPFLTGEHKLNAQNSFGPVLANVGLIEDQQRDSAGSLRFEKFNY